MKLQTKSFLTLLIMFSLLFGVFMTISRYQISNGFLRVEQQSTQDHTNRVRNAISESMYNLGVNLADWAIWDDTYRYMADKNAAYVSANLHKEAMENFNINFIVFMDRAGNMTSTYGIDTLSGATRQLPQDLLVLLQTNQTLLRAEDDPQWHKSGLILSSQGPLLIALRPILTSKGEGPSRGTLMFLRYLDTAEVRRLSAITHLEIKFYHEGQIDLPEHLVKIKQQVVLSDVALIQPFDSETIAGYFALQDVFGNPAVLVEVLHLRDIVAEGKRVFFFISIMGLIAAGVAFVFMNLVMMQNVSGPVSSLQADLYNISSKSDISLRLSVKSGIKEIVDLRVQINDVLDRYSIVEKDIVKLRIAVESSSEIIIMTDSKGIISYVNPQFTKTYGYSYEEVVGKYTPRILKNGGTSSEEYVKLWDTITHHGLYTNEMVNKAKDGRLITVSTSINPIVEENSILGFIGIQQDISDKIDTRITLKKQIADMERLNTLMVDRELKMVELKKEIIDLKTQLSQHTAK